MSLGIELWIQVHPLLWWSQTLHVQMKQVIMIILKIRCVAIIQDFYSKGVSLRVLLLSYQTFYIPVFCKDLSITSLTLKDRSKQWLLRAIKPEDMTLLKKPSRVWKIFLTYIKCVLCVTFPRKYLRIYLNSEIQVRHVHNSRVCILYFLMKYLMSL